MNGAYGAYGQLGGQTWTQWWNGEPGTPEKGAEYTMHDIVRDDTGQFRNLPAEHYEKAKVAVGEKLAAGTPDTAGSWLKKNWPYLVAGGAVLVAGISVAAWKPKGRRKNPKREKIGFMRGAIGLALSGVGAGLIAFPDPLPGVGPSSWVGWPLLIGGLTVWDIKVLPPLPGGQ
jgi:hypothetical protein